MTPMFWLQIVDRSGVVVTLPGGGKLERDLIAECTRAIVAKGVGVFRTQAQVAAAIEAGITDVMRSIKQETRQVVR